MSLGDVSVGEEKVSPLKWCVLTKARRRPIFDRRWKDADVWPWSVRVCEEKVSPLKWCVNYGGQMSADFYLEKQNCLCLALVGEKGVSEWQNFLNSLQNMMKKSMMLSSHKFFTEHTECCEIPTQITIFSDPYTILSNQQKFTNLLPQWPSWHCP